jgi:hypothetical protein
MIRGSFYDHAKDYPDSTQERTMTLEERRNRLRSWQRHLHATNPDHNHGAQQGPGMDVVRKDYNTDLARYRAEAAELEALERAEKGQPLA